MTEKLSIPAQKVISLRDPVKGAVVQLLEDEKMPCLQTQEGLVQLISALSRYTEEGRSLFPQVFVFNALDKVLAVLPKSEHVKIGQGTKTPETMALALKKCAPLAGSGWAVYIERTELFFRYGVMRSGDNLLSLPLSDILIENGLPDLPVLMLQQVGSDVIEIKGVSQSSLLVHFGASRAGEASPVPIIYRFIETVVSSVPVDLREQAAAFYRDAMMDVLHAAHGTLAVVIDCKKRRLPTQFKDGIALQPPISICEKITSLLASGDSLSNTRLLSCRSLITGMLLSDGITVLGADGSVRAYNVFVKHPNTKSVAGSAGGARHRTFETLSKLVGKTIKSSFMLSQDGGAKIAEGSKDD